MTGGWNVRFLSDPILMKVNGMYPLAYSKAQRCADIYIDILLHNTCMLTVPIQICCCF